MDEESFQLVRGVVFLFALALGLALERISRHDELRPAWRTNLGLWAANGLAVGLVCGACACTTARWAADHRVGVLNAFDVHPLIAVPLAILVLDFVSYAWHRANHQVPLLWRFHGVHHADGNFHVTTALRFHPGEVLLSLPARLAAIVLIETPVLGVLVFEAVFMCANILEHGNFNVPRRLERVLAVILVTPALHRWHHSREGSQLNTNFGTILCVWDRFLRTFERSDSGRRIRTGLPSGSARAASLPEALAAPFPRSEGHRGGRERAQ
jgi:sterol desaturase/sphingolipid hydroxylase (fatty acid hydroxylase superfamily)